MITEYLNQNFNMANINLGFLAIAMSTSNLQAQKQLQPLKDLSHGEGLCTMCEEYSATALGYLSNNKTQTKILGLLLTACSKMPIYKDEVLVI